MGGDALLSVRGRRWGSSQKALSHLSGSWDPSGKSLLVSAPFRSAVRLRLIAAETGFHPKMQAQMLFHASGARAEPQVLSLQAEELGWSDRLPSLKLRLCQGRG